MKEINKDVKDEERLNKGRTFYIRLDLLYQVSQVSISSIGEKRFFRKQNHESIS